MAAGERVGRGRPTSTSAFGVGRRENHDATDFYARFAVPELSTDDTVTPAPELPGTDGCLVGDSRDMRLPDGSPLPDGCVALVVTSPPYFAGKAYEQELGEGHIPGSYVEYLEMLRDVFAECKRVLEPGGRIAVNIANLGRKPYRSLSADVIRILQDDLGLLLRGEVIWQKAEAAGGNCAWGSFRSPANPVLRDLTERVVIASKGRFDRARTTAERRKAGMPHAATITTDEFLEATLDVWRIPPESARRVGHPAPFPVELPQRLIGLYTYVGDLVLDPFLGSGSTMLAAVRTGRHFVGYDIDPAYVTTARERVAAELARTDGGEARADDGQSVGAVAEDMLVDAGFVITGHDVRPRGLGVEISLTATDADGTTWNFDVSGGFTTTKAGLVRSDSMWRALGRAHVLAANNIRPVVFLTSTLPRRMGDAAALWGAGPRAFFDAVELRSPDGLDRLRHYAKGGHTDRPRPGFWSDKDLRR